MSGTPNWNPPLQTSSARFPRKAVETPQIPPNTTVRPRPGTSFQPVYPNPITQIPGISASTDPSGALSVYHQLYTLSSATNIGYGDAIVHGGRRGVPTPTVKAVKTAERYLVFTVAFAYPMTGTDHFVFTFLNMNTQEKTVKNFQPSVEYIVGGLLPGVLYLLTVAPVVNGITYPGFTLRDPLTISAVSEKNVQLQGVTITGGDKYAKISWANATPQPPNAFEVTTVAIDDTFGDPQQILTVVPTYPASPNPPLNYSGSVQINNLTNGVAYTFTITPVHYNDGLYEYGRPTTLPPFIPGPPGDLVITGTTAGQSSITLNVTYDTATHPFPDLTTVTLYKSTLTTLCSLVGQSTTAVQDFSQTYASFTTSTGLFTAQGFASIAAAVASSPGSIQVDLLNDKGYWYTFPLTDVSTGGLGYTFGNSNFVKTTNLLSTASSYSVLFRSVNLSGTGTSYQFNYAQTSLTISSLPLGSLYTLVGTNYANGLSSLISAYATTAIGSPDSPSTIVSKPGNQLVSLSFTGYNPAGTFPRPVSYLYTAINTGNTYTSINSNILILGVPNSTLYTIGIQGFANGLYGPSGTITVTPGLQPPTNLFVSSISNYDLTISFAPAVGGADYYQIQNQFGLSTGLSGGLYKFQNLSADVGYIFRGQSFAYGDPIYTLISTDPSASIMEVSTSYAQFLVSPSVATLSYASTMITNLQYYAPYNYTISGGGTSYSFKITSMTPVYDVSGTLQWYNIANTSAPKAVATFSGATTYFTTLSSTIALYPGMVPSINSGIISSSVSLPTSPSAYVGPPGSLSVTASGYSSQRLFFIVTPSGPVIPSRYDYTEITGKNISGSSLSSNIVIENLTNGSSYTFSVSAFVNQVYGLTGISAGPFVLNTTAPSNASATFSNTTATVTFSGYVGPGITYTATMYANGYPGTIVQTASGFTGTSWRFDPSGVSPATKYGFTILGVQAGISSVIDIVNPIIAGPPLTPKNILTTLSTNSVTFNWSSGDVGYNQYGETYTVTEYLSNNGVCNATGLVRSGLASQTYTISSVITASGTQTFLYGQWLETSPGYASFILSNTPNFTDSPIGTRVSSNQIYLTLQQSGLVYTFPLSTVTRYNDSSNIYANTNYAKTPGDVFNPTLSVSVTYSYGTGPLNGGTYSYAFTSYANQVSSPQSNVGATMFVLPVAGVPSVSVVGTAATISFAQVNNPAGTVYRVTNNYGATVSRAPYTFANLSVGIPYTFSVVASNGVFVSVSSELTDPRIYVGPPPIPLVEASYFGQVALVSATDTTISLATVFYDTGTQNTGQTVTTASHANVIQNSSGGFWVNTLPSGYGPIKDSSTGFLCTQVPSYAMYSNEGYSNALYQFAVTPSSGTISATLSAYTLTITGSSLSIKNAAGVQVYTGTTLSDTYPVQLISYSNGFGIQSGAGGGNNLLYYSQIPAGSDSLVFTMTSPASFSNFQVSRIQTVGPATVSYGIGDQFGLVYTPSLQTATYTPAGLQYTYEIFDIPYAVTLTLGITPYANSVAGPRAYVDVHIFTGSPGKPQVSILDTTATITVPQVAIGSVDNYFLDIITGGTTISTLSAVATASAAYIFQYPGLLSHSNYYFSAYAKYRGTPSTPVQSGPYEAGRPFSGSLFPGIVSAIFTTSNVATGTYTISALVDPGQNSNALITTGVYTASTLVTSQSITISQQKVFLFTVSSGAVYALSTSAFMNGYTATPSKPSVTLTASPFPPQAVGLTISSSDYGATYYGAVSITASSATPNVSYIYGYIKDGSLNPINPGNNTFSVTYGSVYQAYAYTVTTLGGTLLSSNVYSGSCNVFLSPPTDVQAAYNNSNITLTWSGATDGNTYSYTVTAGSTISQNIPRVSPTVTYLTTASLGTTTTFFVRGQSAVNPSASIIYSSPVSVSVALVTQSVSAYASYSGAQITVSFSIASLTTFSSAYTFGVTCICGSVTNNTQFSSPTNLYQSAGYGFTASGFGQSLVFSVQPLLYGIYGLSAQTTSINLTASAMMNVSQSYTGTQYTISWSQIASGYSYTVQELFTNTLSSTTTTGTSLNFTLSLNLSYQFQTFATYNGIPSAVTSLSSIYTYTNPISGSPSTSYAGNSITVSWSAVAQADGHSPDYYRIQNVYPGGPSVDVTRGPSSTSKDVPGVSGGNYAFTVTPYYNGIAASNNVSGIHIGLYTNPPTNVQVTNSGSNIIVTWSASTVTASGQNTIIYTLSQTSGTTILSGTTTTSATTYAPSQSLTPNPNVFYNYAIIASTNGFDSSGASATTCGLVYTYPPTSVTLDYLGNETPTSHPNPRTSTLGYNISPIVSWSNNTSQKSTAFYTITISDTTIPANSPTNTVPIQPNVFSWKNPVGSPTINFSPSNVGDSMVPYIYATNNGLPSIPVSAATPVRIFTDKPGIVGCGFDGLYRITINICRGPTGNAPEYYMVQEMNNAFSTNINSYLYPNSIFTISYSTAESTVFQLPLTGTQGYTYNFQVYATQKGVYSTVNTTLSSYKLATTAVSNTAVTYSGTAITFSWSDAPQPAYDGSTSSPNGGYTIYVTPGNPYVPLANLYYSTSYQFAGIPGQTYFFTIEAVHNNITSSPTQSPYVTLYQPVVTNLAATNSCSNGADVSMILTWTPDILNASGAKYYAVSYNQSSGTINASTTAANASTITFTGSIGVTYSFFVQGVYQGISGLAQSVQMTNARPSITSFSLTNLGNNIFAQYTVTPVGSPVTLSAYNTSTSTAITSISYTSATTATILVSASTEPGYKYTISATATCNGIPSTVCGAPYTMIQPNKPSSISTVYNNALVSVSWASATNASAYTFVAYDLSTNQQTNIQTYIPQTYTTFVGTLGHSYSLSVTAYSSTYIPSVTANTSMAIVIPQAPSGLSLCNAGALVTVTWTTDASKYSNYSFTVVNASSAGTIFYQSLFANSGDTFLAAVGQTFRVNLFGTSLCNVTSTTSTVSSLFIYQPSITSVTATNVGADITLTFPPDSDKTKTCEYLLTNNYGYSNLLYSASGFSSSSYTQTISDKYTQTANGYISYTVVNCSYVLAGYAYLFTVVPYYRLVPGPGVQTPTVNPITLYKPTSPGQFMVTNQGSDLLLSWQSSSIDTSPVPTLVPSYKVEVSQVTPSGTWPNVTSPKYVTGTSTTFGGYNSTAGQLSVSVTAIIPGYDTNFTGSYIYGYTANKTYTIPDQTSVSIKQTDPVNPQILSVTIPPMAAPWIWFRTTAVGVTSPVRYTVVSNQDNTQSIFQTCNVTVSTGLYYTISAYGWVDGTTFPGPASAIAIASANPNPYPATTFNVSLASIKTSHSGTTVTVSWGAVAQAEFYQVQEYDSIAPSVVLGGSDLITTTSWVSTITPPHVPGSSYNFQITAFTVSNAKFDGQRITLPSNIANNCNAYFPTLTSASEILYIPGPVVNLTPTQFLQTVSLTWLQPSVWNPPNTAITTTSANTIYFIQQLSGTTTTVLTTKTISGGGSLPQVSFNISAGRTYTYTVSTTYYGIPTTTSTTATLTTVNPLIQVSIRDGGDTKAYVTLSANTPGTWTFYNGNTVNTQQFVTNCNIGTFGAGTTVPPNGSCNVSFIADLGGLSVSQNLTQITFVNPAITTCSITDNFTDGTLTLNLVASIGGSGTYTPITWTVPSTVGTLTLSTSPANSSSTTAVYKKALAAQTYNFSNITVAADGFQSATSSVSYTTPTFTVSQNPAQITMANPKTLNAFFFSPELTNIGPPRTLSASLTLSSTISWNFPTSLSGVGTIASYSPLTGSGIVSVSYTTVGGGTTVSFPANSVSVNYQGYTVSLGSVVSYNTPNPSVTVGSTATRFVDNQNGTLTLNLCAAGCTGGAGDVTWTVPSSVSGNGTSPDALTVSGSPSTGVSSSVVYTGAKYLSTYTISTGNVSVAYTGYTNSNSANIVSSAVSIPQITAISSRYFGCTEDKALTGTDSITVSVSANLASTWTITACTALTLNSSSGQGSKAIQWAFSGGLKNLSYDFAVGSCNTTVTLTKPTANVTPAFSQFTSGASPTGVLTTITGGSGSTFVVLESTKVTKTDTSITVDTGSALTTGTHTVSAAAISNGILGNISSYQFAICPTPTKGTITLTALNEVTIAYTQTDSAITYQLVSGFSSPTTPDTTLPSGQTVQLTQTGGTSFTLSLDSIGAKSFYIIGKTTLNGQSYFGIGSSLITFTYKKDENILSSQTPGSIGIYTFNAGGTLIQTLMNATLTSGKGGNGSATEFFSGGAGGFGQTYTINGWTGLQNGQQIWLVPASDGGNGGNDFEGPGLGGVGGSVSSVVGGHGGASSGFSGTGGGGGGSLYIFTIPASFAVIIPGGGGGGGASSISSTVGVGGGGGAGARNTGGTGAAAGIDGLNGGGGGLGDYGGGSGGRGGVTNPFNPSVAHPADPGSNASEAHVTGSAPPAASAVATTGAGFSINIYWITT